MLVQYAGSLEGKSIPTSIVASKVQEKNQNVLRVENLSKIYNSESGKVVALSNINFTVKKGEFVSILGPSGSGKSTLLYMIGALDRPSAGKVYINGVDVFSLNDSEIAMVRNRLIGYIFQSYNLINRSTVIKNVKIPVIISGMARTEANFKAIEIMKALGIGDKINEKAANLSGGQQQRVAIARALVNNPSIILADEPTGNLDTKTGREVFEILKKLSRQFNRTIIMVTHNAELAEETDRSIFIKDGSIERETRH